MGMHNFGEKRWGSGIVDDIRSFNDQNTRIVGDFTKMVRVPPIMSKMFQLVSEDSDWQIHFERIILDSAFPELQEFDPIIPKIIQSCEWLAENSKTFRRQTLQTRFFETGTLVRFAEEESRKALLTTVAHFPSQATRSISAWSSTESTPHGASRWCTTSLPH